MASVREWHQLHPIEQSLARCVMKAGTQAQMEAVVDSLSKSHDIAVKKSHHGGWFIYSIPSAARR